LSVRTLHHYDQIGLLCPQRNAENGYRAYADADLVRLQQILFFRECGFTLAKIRDILAHPAFDREKAFAMQRKYLLHERARIDAMLRTLDRTMKGGKVMSEKEKFEGFDVTKNPYEAEARALWGDEAVDRSNACIAAKTEETRGSIGEDLSAAFGKLATMRHEDPAGEAVQNAVNELYRFFNRNFGQYTLEAFAGVGRMYVEDERFMRTMEQFGEGTSAFLMRAMESYAVRNAQLK